MEYISVVISVIALLSSIYIGFSQVKISKHEMEMQNKVELYLLVQTITLHNPQNNSNEIVPAIYIRNLGANVIYLQQYIYNGNVYPLNEEVLPPVSAYDGFRYILLPTDGQVHVSLSIDFFDWKKEKWQTTGYADYANGDWNITYSPCKRV